MVLTPRRWCQVSRSDPRNDGGKKARSPGRARSKPLKPLRAGMPGESGCTCGDYARVLILFCTRGCGCGGHPAFPTPSLIRGAHDSCTTRAHRAARARSCVCRHCEERSDKAIHCHRCSGCGLLRGACHRARIRATRWIAMTVQLRPTSLGEDCVIEITVYSRCMGIIPEP